MQPYIIRNPARGRFPFPARNADVTSESDRFHKLRHDLSNPLSALLAETQLLLLNESKLDPETLTSLREIEALAVRMRGILRES
jgi:signal transduction histidine kinase